MTGWRKSLAAGLAALLLFPIAASALTAEEQQRFADGLFSRGLHEMALTEYRRAIEQFPDYPDRDVLLFRAAECSRKMGQGAQAMDYLRKIVTAGKAGPYLDRSRLRLSEQHVQAGQVKEAIPMLEAILAANPAPETAAPALYYLGLARVKNGEKEVGRRGFAGILAQHPESSFAPYAALELARLLNEAGSPFAEVKAMADRVLVKPPSDAIALETRLLLMDAANRRDDFKGASSAYLDLLKASPQDARVRESALKAAWACLRSEKFAEVLEVLKAVPDEVRKSHEADVLYLEANALRKTGRGEEALARYNDLAGRHAQSTYAPYAAYETALVAHASKRFEEVVSRAALLAREPTLAADGGWLVADSLRELGRTDEAVDAFVNWSAANPADPRAPDALYLAAQMRQQQKRFADASVLYLQLANAHGAHALAPRALYGSALALLAENRLPDAVASWLKLADAHPDHELAKESLLQAGLALVKLEKKDDALKVFERLTAKRPGGTEEAQAAYWSGILLEQNKNFAAAEPLFRRVMELNNDVSLVARASLRLAFTLQKLQKPGEAATLLQGLLDKPVVAEMDPALLEWLARYGLQEKRPEDAARAAGLLAGRKGIDAQWNLIGHHMNGIALRQLGKNPDALAAFQAACAIDLNTRERADAALQAGELLLDAGKPADATKSFEDGSNRASGLALLDLQARGYLGLGKAAVAAGNHDGASRFFLSVAVLFDDPIVTPEALKLAAESLRKLNRAAEADKALAELKTRYPAYTP